MPNVKAPISIGSTFVSSNYSNQHFTRNTFLRSIYVGVDFSNTTFKNFVFIDCIFTGCNFTNADLSGVSFIYCTMDNKDINELVLVRYGVKGVDKVTIINKGNNELNNDDNYRNELQFEEAFSVWKLFQKSYLYEVLNTGKFGIYEDGEDNSFFELNTDAVWGQKDVDFVWYISKDLESDFKNRREVYCFVAGLLYTCNVMYPDHVVTSELVHEVITEHLKTNPLRDSYSLTSLDSIKDLVSKFVIMAVKKVDSNN